MTEFLIDGRGTGKSAAAVKWVRGAGNRYLVAADSARAASLLATDHANSSRAGVSKLHPEKIIPYSSLRNGRYMGQTLELAVDDLDLLLAQVFLRPVGFVTATGTLHAAPVPLNQISIGGTA